MEQTATPKGDAMAALPQLAGGLFLSDGGLETSLIYLDGIDLPQFAAFPLAENEAGRAQLERYYRPYLELAAATPGAGYVLETPTWRASADWGASLGCDAGRLAAVNRSAALWLHGLRREWQARIAGPIVLAGIIGPRGDGYIADAPDSAEAAAAFHRVQAAALAEGGVDMLCAVTMTTSAEALGVANAAAAFHPPQAAALAEGGVDMLCAVTMTTSAEALGVANAAAAVGVPVSISFTVETDGRLPNGEALRDAIERVDAEAAVAPAYFGINCAHPSHFDAVFADGGAWASRIQSLRANASARSHAELDAATELDIGDLPDLADRYRRLRAPLPRLNVLGGCCGTDHRHLRAIRDAWLR